MKKNRKVWYVLITAVFVFGLPSLFLYFDSACHPISHEVCRLWLNFQWESILAGLFGLGGGIFVVTSTRMQIAHDTKKYIDTKTALTSSVTAHVAKLAILATAVEPFLETYGDIEKMESDTGATWNFIEKEVDGPNAGEIARGIITTIQKQDNGTLHRILEVNPAMDADVRRVIENIVERLYIEIDNGGAAEGDPNARSVALCRKTIETICNGQEHLENILSHLRTIHTRELVN